jgi:hypothetical protein
LTSDDVILLDGSVPPPLLPWSFISATGAILVPHGFSFATSPISGPSLNTPQKNHLIVHFPFITCKSNSESGGTALSHAPDCYCFSLLAFCSLVW